MIKKNIIIQKTARYFISGIPAKTIKNVWFVCHGYGQLANYFIKNFNCLDATENLIVAPEGLHRFYWEQFSGRVVASWMTKEDRTDDIADYINYLNAVYDEIMTSFKETNVKINILGFSQGTATVCRWASDRKLAINNLILWAGGFPEDMEINSYTAWLNTFFTYLIVGDSDEFITTAQTDLQKKILMAINVPFEFISFNGKHIIDQPTLLQLSKKL